MKMTMAICVLVAVFSGCAAVGLGGLNQTLYESEQTITTETFGDGPNGTRVLLSRVTEYNKEHIDGITRSGPFSRITGDVGTTVTYDGVTGNYTVTTAGKAEIEGGLDEVLTYFAQAAASVGRIQASETAAVMAEVSALLVELQKANERAEEKEGDN